ncbi:MAG: D-2-hydroxyacid dehydrogenase [Bacillota bacterium]|nr:D-2-hydroxyacid dehydrogenase [Bacillota bacterium]
MEQLKILALSRLSDEGVAAIEAVAPGIRVLRAPTREEAEALVEEADVIYGTRLSAGAAARARQLKWVHAPAAGVDRLLTPELVSGPVAVTCSRGLHAHSLSEHAFALMLALARRLPEFWEDRRDRRWQRREGRVLAGGALLVVGLGAVGTEVARKGLAFGMRVLAVRRTAHPGGGGPADAAPGLKEVGGPDSLLRLLGRADWVVLCVPLTTETREMIGRRELEAMKPTAHLINVARGEVVDEPALVSALKEGRIAGAGLDVFAAEPLPPESELWGLPNVVITPHMGGSMEDYEERALGIFLDNLRRFLAGEPLRNVVDKGRGY